jgi:O-succinylbenzoate synthase
MQEYPSENMSVTEHVREAWRLLLLLPDGERERVTEHLAGRYAWSEVEAGATALRRASRLDVDTAADTDALRTATDLASAEEELAEITANLTPTDVAKVRNLVEALRDGLVTVSELHELPDAQWMELIASRRAA